MIFDSHSHTAFSADSEMKAADAIAMADKAGVGLVFTEHLDFDYPGEMDFSFDPQAYWQAYEPYRGDNLRLGIEIGMNEAILEGNLHFLEQEPFDLVIGSQHIVDGQDIYLSLIHIFPMHRRSARSSTPSPRMQAWTSRTHCSRSTRMAGSSSS